jgi:uncharacterized cupredoxin-like copper-binding protein
MQDEETHLADLPSNPDTGGDNTVEPDRESSTGTPRWVKVFGIITLVVVLLFVILLLIGGGGHGPSRHTVSSGVGESTAANEATRMAKAATLDTITFVPSRIWDSAGETVTSTVITTGRVVHEFTPGDATMQQKHVDDMAYDEPGHCRAGMRGQIAIS